ncbi:MmgE/PrpD family protein [Ottowia sp. VDI28]|uniref:MmgE/PrpD family protein n=1 Tax=Ottowia sp. VDI28 TaxID=3133968 RepID=UPI003C2E1773
MSGTTTEDFAATLSRFATRLTMNQLPPSAILAAKANIFDTLACAAAGSSAAGIAELRGLATEWGGAPQASTLVFGDKLPAHHAAWVNGAMAHARDYDDTHDAAVLHAGVSVVPAALAAAELAGGVPGADFIAGVAAGLETICRLGVATQIGIIESGYMYTSLFGHFAATVAASRVLGLNEGQMVNALGINYSQAAGNHQVTRDAALTKRMQPGFAAMSALIAAQMAQRGVRGVQNTFEGEDGFLRVYLHDRCDRAVLRAHLGEQFEFTQLSYKPYPCCRFNHPAISAALALRQVIGGQTGQIRKVRVGLNYQAYEAVCTPVEVRKAPKTVVQAQFSIPYTVAAALIDGGVRLEHFADTSLGREDLLSLASKVDASVDEEIERQAGRNISPVLLEIEMNDGTAHRLRVDAPLGHPSHPMSENDFDTKARDCMRMAARPLGDNAASRLRAQVNQLDKSDNASELIRALAPAG